MPPCSSPVVGLFPDLLSVRVIITLVHILAVTSQTKRHSSDRYYVSFNGSGTAANSETQPSLYPELRSVATASWVSRQKGSDED